MNYQIKVYNSLTNSIQDFKPIHEGKISMYVCGPTVYNDAHIGNGRPIVFFDTVERFFKYLNYEVVFASNFTDIDDKIIKKAIEENTTDEVISKRYIDAYLEVCRNAGCNSDIIRPKVTENIPEILTFIKKLVDQGYAYQAGTDVYFRVHSVPSYGMLSNQKLDELDAGNRIEINELKEDPRDFTLWKKTSDTGRKWDSPFGCGRPGWHTECVVMINKIFGDKIDIHGGGTDLKFPHHENEIAQSMALNHNAIANFWIHNARIDLKGEKMSKSLGNVIWLKDILSKYPYQAYRLFILANHYRQNISYSDELMNNMVNEWQKLRKTYVSLYRYLELQDSLDNQKADNQDMEKFLNEMAYDFNTANALSVIYDLVKTINKDLRANATIEILKKEYYALKDMFEIFGLDPEIKTLSNEEKTLVITWQTARKNKDFQLADILRQKITELGIEL